MKLQKRATMNTWVICDMDKRKKRRLFRQIAKVVEWPETVELARRAARKWKR